MPYNTCEFSSYLPSWLVSCLVFLCRHDSLVTPCCASSMSLVELGPPSVKGENPNMSTISGGMGGASQEAGRASYKVGGTSEGVGEASTKKGGASCEAGRDSLGVGGAPGEVGGEDLETFLLNGALVKTSRSSAPSPQGAGGNGAAPNTSTEPLGFSPS